MGRPCARGFTELILFGLSDNSEAHVIIPILQVRKLRLREVKTYPRSQLLSDKANPGIHASLFQSLQIIL